MHPIFIQIGPLVIRWYGVMIALGCLIGLWLAKKEAERNGIGKEKIEGFFLYAIFGAVIGARIYYVAFTGLTRFWENPFSVFAIWEGGLAVHGAILGGILVAFFYARRHRIPFARLADTLSPSFILGQAIGRIGCFLNGDAYGYPTGLPWGVVYAPESPAGRMFPDQALHPTQLYEMILNLIIFGILWKTRKTIKTRGGLFILYIILYSAARIFTEHFRADELTYLGSISAAQSMGVLGIVLGLVMLSVLNKKGGPISGIF